MNTDQEPDAPREASGPYRTRTVTIYDSSGRQISSVTHHLPGGPESSESSSKEEPTGSSEKPPDDPHIIG
jgi:hypothetical protein